MPKTVFSMDIGGTNIRYGFVDRDYNLNNFNMLKTEQILKDTLKDLCELIGHQIKENDVEAVALGFPSALDKDRKKLLSTPNIKGLDNVDVVEYIEQKLGVSCFIDRDVNFLFLYDLHKNKLSKGVVLGFYVGTGLGNVIAIDGNILYGKNGVAAELGHIPLYKAEGVCGCGNVGCVELYASGKRLKQIVEENNYSFSDVFVKHSEDKAIREFIETLSYPIATEISIFDPDHVIIGGGVSHMEDFPQKMLEEYIKAHTRKPFPAQNLDIKYSEQNQNNGVIGGAIYAYRKLGK